MIRCYRLAATGQLGHGPPALAEQGVPLQADRVGVALGWRVAAEPGEVDPLLPTEVAATEAELGRAHPDARADAGKADAGLLGELPPAGAGRVLATAGQFPPVAAGLDGIVDSADAVEEGAASAIDQSIGSARTRARRHAAAKAWVRSEEDAIVDVQQQNPGSLALDQHRGPTAFRVDGPSG